MDSKILVIGIAGLYQLSSTVAAQPASGSQSGRVLEEVMVTARRVEESLEDVPISITAIGAAEINELGIQDTSQIGAYVPNITMDLDANRTNNTQIYIRGVGGGNGNASGTQPGVGLYIDGVYMPRTEGGYTSTLDIERIEVLRGPQGTLFGKNTTGGAVNIVSVKPQPEQSSSLTFRTGNYNRREARGMFNMPITDKLYARIAGVAEARDGYYTEITTGQDYGNRREFAGRVALRYLPTDQMTWDISGTYAYQPQRPPGGACVYNNPHGFHGLTENLTGVNFQEACGESNLEERTFSSDVRGYSNTTIWGVNSQMSWDADGSLGFLDNATVNLLAGVRGQSNEFLMDSEWSRARIETRGRGPTDYLQSSFELQLTGTTANDRLALITGIYWADDSAEETGNDCQDEFNAVDIAGGETISCDNPGGFQIFIVPDAPVTQTVAQVSSTIETAAIYANVSYDLTDTFNVTVGARQTKETRDFSRFDVAGVEFFRDIWRATLSDENISFNTFGKDSWSEMTPMLSFRYSLPGTGLFDSGNVYFTYAGGFQSGGFNTEFIRSELGDAFIYDPETVDSYELGLKGTMADGRVRLSLAAYNADYNDKQVEINLDNNGQFASSEEVVTLISNAATMNASGVELELSVTPTDNILFNLAFGTIDAEYEEFLTFDPVTQTTINATDRRVDTRNPEETGSGFFEYTFDLPGGGTFRPRLIGYYRSGFEWDFDRPITAPRSPIYQDSWTKWDARLNWQNASGDLRVTGFVTNLTDETTLRNGSDIVENRGWTILTLDPPRTYGIEVNMQF